MDKPTLAAIELAIETKCGQYYDGELCPELGSWAWDAVEECYAVRVAEKDQPYPCGVDCCGYAQYAVVAVYRH